MEVKGKNIAIFGLGVSGLSALAYCVEQKASVRVINKGEVSKWKAKCDPYGDSIMMHSDTEKDLDELLLKVDLILLSPGIPREHTLLEKANKDGVPIWNEIELAAQNFSKKIIAVTGTNGKTTTVTMLAEALNLSGRKTFVGGNIGTPFLECLRSNEDYEIAVLELSSFQLESLESFRPDIAMILNIEENHGERYRSVLDYAKAKANIANHLSDKNSLILGSVFEYLSEISLNTKPKWIKLPAQNEVDKELDISLPMNLFRLVGAHNRLNLWFVLKTFKILELKKDGLVAMIKSFRGVPHRLENLGFANQGKVEFFNDAKSTNWNATKSAIEAVRERHQYIWLICGGKNRRENESLETELKNYLLEKTHKILLFGESAKNLKKDLPESLEFEKLDQAMNFLKKNLKEGVALFSPGHPSFDQYSNYVKRGEHFCTLFSNLNNYSSGV